MLPLQYVVIPHAWVSDPFKPEQIPVASEHPWEADVPRSLTLFSRGKPEVDLDPNRGPKFRCVEGLKSAL